MCLYIRTIVWGSDPTPCPLLTLLNLSKHCQFGLFFFPRVFYFPLPLQSQCNLCVTLADLGCVGLQTKFSFSALVSFLLQPQPETQLSFAAYLRRSLAPCWATSALSCISLMKNMLWIPLFDAANPACNIMHLKKSAKDKFN